MKLSEGVEWGLHCTTLLALLPPGSCLPATRLAEFHGVPPAYLAKSLQAMSRAGLVEAVPGAHGGYRLALHPDKITVLDIVEAVDGSESSFRCTEIRRRGPAGLPARCYPSMCGIAATMNRADAAWRAELGSTTVSDLIVTLGNTVHPDAVTKGITWLQSVLPRKELQ